MNSNNQPKKGDLSYPVWEFNYKPERYIHKSWLHSLPNGELVDKLMGEGRDTERLSNFLISQLGFDGKFFFDFSNISSQVALWSARDLKKLVMYTGLCCHYKDIQRLILREKVLEVRSHFGDEMYAFAMKRAAVFMDFQPEILEFKQRVHLNNRIIISGLVCLHSYMCRFPTAFMKRVIIKLPREWFEHMIKYTPQVSQHEGRKLACIQVIEKAVCEVERDHQSSKNPPPPPDNEPLDL
ncbi:MAG: SctK family type III secretion system sorting platform protein [Cocleimonas sp.]|nr:SctK family type III secretion system sorting platform protein [Cocleimonas sp.]